MSLSRPAHYLLLLLAICGCNALWAQQVVTGHITDAKHNPLSFVTVVLQSARDSTILGTELTDTAGNYRITAPVAASTLLKVIAPGYRQQAIPLTDTTSPSLTLDLTLSASGTALSGVTVSAAKPLIERRADRSIFNVANSAAAVGSDAFEALKRAPGIRVTNNQVSIAGKSTVNVLINDRLVQVSGDELVALLRSIPADNLSRIEIITTPPAKYDAAGNAGLINIVTKKQQKNGLNGSVTAGVTQRTMTGGGLNANFNFRHNKLNVFGTGNAFRFAVQPDVNVTTRYADQTWVQHNDATELNVFNRMVVGADYNLNDRMVIGGQYTIGNGGSEFYADQLVTARAFNLHTGNVDSVIRTWASFSDRGFRNAANLNYEWKIDSSGRKLSIDLDYFNRRGQNQRGFTTRHFLNNEAPTGIESTNRTSGKQIVDIRSAKADITWPSSFAQLSFGGKVSFIHNTSDNLFQYLQDSTFQTDLNKTNEFDYQENTQALYLSAQKTLGKWELQLGLRGEYTQTKGYSATLNQTNTNNYFQVFPTAYIQYKPNDDHAFNLNYSRRIDRPSFWNMNPFRTYFTATSYEQGNPFLQPSFSNNIELGYLLRSKYSFMLYAQFIDRMNTNLSVIDTSTKSYYFTQGNAGSVANYGMSFNLTLNPAKWWECLLTGNAYYSQFHSAYYDSGNPVSYSRPAFFVETENTFTLNKAKTLLTELGLSYYSRQLSDFDIQRSYYTTNIGFKALLAKKQLILALSFNDLLRSDRWVVDNQYNGTLQENYYDERLVRLALTWKFGNSGIKDKRERATGNDDAGRAR